MRSLYLGFLVSVAIAFVFGTGLSRGSEPTSKLPQLVIGAPGEGAFGQLFQNPSEWRRARSHIGGVIDADYQLAGLPDAELASRLKELGAWGLSLELEVGVIKEWNLTGAGMFYEDRKYWDRIIKLGGNIFSIVLQEPLVASRQIAHRPDSYALDQAATFIIFVRKFYPKIRIGDVEAYPYISVNDQKSWLEGLQERLSAAHVQGLDFYRVDPDWVAFDMLGKGAWRPVVALRDFCRSLGIPFSLIYWPSDYPQLMSLGFANDQTWSNELMAEGYAFAKYGNPPDQFVLEDWLKAPQKMTPETQPFTFTYTVLDFFKTFVDRSGL